MQQSKRFTGVHAYGSLALSLVMVCLWATCVAQISTLTLAYDDAAWLVPLLICFVLTGLIICIIIERVVRCRKSPAVCTSIVEMYFALVLSVLFVAYVHVATFAEVLSACRDMKHCDSTDLTATTLLIVDILFMIELVVLFVLNCSQGRLLNRYIQQELSGATISLSAADAAAAEFVQDASDDHYA